MHEWRFSVAIVMSVQLLTGGWRNNAHYLDGQALGCKGGWKKEKETFALVFIKRKIRCINGYFGACACS